jgi:hypothetical protein
MITKTLIMFIYLLLVAPVALTGVSLQESVDMDPEVVVVVQLLAECQNHFKCADFNSAYNSSRKALRVTRSWTEPSDGCLLFISLFQHVIICDQLQFLEECQKSLRELVFLHQQIIESQKGFDKDSNVLIDAILADFLAFAELSKTPCVKETLNALGNQLLTDFKTEHSLCEQNNIQAKKIWKRSAKWWNKQLAKWLKTINDIEGVLQKLQRLLDWK